MRSLSLLYAVLCLGPLTVQAAPTAPLNDTGITWSGDATSGNAETCYESHPAGQDCHYGRDAAAAAGNLNKTGTGAGGFDFTKIANNGDELDATATLGSAANQWACTRDNVTGLIWEVKVNDANHLRHQNHTYTWYNTNSPDGNKGTASGGSCKTSGRCDTEKFVADVNNASLCGASDWRMPTIKELESIVHYGRVAPAIDTSFFPNTPSSYVWSGSPYASHTSYAWGVHFYNGSSGTNYRSNGSHVRLVRGGQ